MSDTKKIEKGARTNIPHTNEGKDINRAIKNRHTFGFSEKILRRCRKIWTRLANKRRRAIDKKEIKEMT
jgi:hypothetical protein